MEVVTESLSEAYLESTTSTVEVFHEKSQRLKVIIIFRKKAPPWMFDWALNTPLFLVDFDKVFGHWYWIQRRIQNRVKYLRWNFLQKLLAAKSF